MFYSVLTPTTIKEISLPNDEDRWTEQQIYAMERLEDLAEAHGTQVVATTYRRGQ